MLESVSHSKAGQEVVTHTEWRTQATAGMIYLKTR